MILHRLHNWNTAPEEMAALQRQLAGQVITEGAPENVKLIAGLDISSDKRTQTGYAVGCLFDYPEIGLAGIYRQKGVLSVPYITGYLSFREGELLCRLLEAMPRPDLLFIDGQGTAHPRGLGIACHIGLFADIPTIGVAKSHLVGNYSEPGTVRGDYSPLYLHGKTIGAVLRTKMNTKPVFVSPGHKISLDSAIEWTLYMDKGYRIPEPTRQADLLTKSFRKGQDE